MKFFKRKKKKAKKKKVEKAEFKPFLTKIDSALVDLFVEDRATIKQKMYEEAEKWLNSLEEIDSDSFKAGVCYAVYRTLKLLEKERGGYVV